MKRKPVISVLLAALLLVSLVGCGGDPGTSSVESVGSQVTIPPENTPPVEPAQPQAPVISPAEPTEPPKDPVPEPITPPVEPAAPKITPIRLMQADGYSDHWDDQFRTLASVEWSELALMDDYPELSAALERLNAEQAENANRFVDEWLPAAKDALAQSPEFFGGFTASSAYTIQRADSLVVSIREDYSDYTGGVHPNYGAKGLNFDTASGELLGLEAVLITTDGLSKLLSDKLQEKYADRLFSDPATVLAGYTAENYTWTLGYQGVTFYFSPYELAPYAAGLLTVTVWFDEMPELFRSEYTFAPEGGYIMALPDWNEIEFDLDPNDGRRDILSAATMNGEYGSVYLSLTMNGQEYAEQSWMAFGVQSFLVCVDGRFYLYAESVGENGFRTLYTYDLNSGTPVLTSEFSGVGRVTHWGQPMGLQNLNYYEVLNTPVGFDLQTKCNLLGSKMAVRSYAVAGDGTLTALSDVYTLSRDLPPITSSVSLEVLILSSNTVETIPAQTTFAFLRTDNETYVDLMLPDGRECRITIREIDWTPTINGIPEWDCFSDLMYAD